MQRYDTSCFVIFDQVNKGKYKFRVINPIVSSKRKYAHNLSLMQHARHGMIWYDVILRKYDLFVLFCKHGRYIYDMVRSSGNSTGEHDIFRSSYLFNIEYRSRIFRKTIYIYIHTHF